MTKRDQIRAFNSWLGEVATKFGFTFIVALLTLGPIQNGSAQTITVLHTFPAFDGDGIYPFSPLWLDDQGELYGTTFQGGDVGSGYGTVFEMSESGDETILFNFNFYNGVGAYPTQPLLRAADGTLYGTAMEGNGGSGVVFKLSPTGEETILHSFVGGQNSHPKVPSSGVVMDSAGNLYGVTLSGGHSSCNRKDPPYCGTVYELDPKGKLTVLHSFTGGSDGAAPSGNLILDTAGNLYGVTIFGGDLSCPLVIAGRSGCGVVFKMDPTGNETVLYAFTGGADGASPAAGSGLVMDADGNIYGVAQYGGEFGQQCEVQPGYDNYGCGTVFKLSSSGVFTVLHEFNNDGSEGVTPNGGLVLDPSGNLYGTTQESSLSGGLGGTVFELSPGGELTVLYNFEFDDFQNGDGPAAGLVRDSSGNLYGTTVGSGGNVFKLTP
jgi:uncharacterized repeat protein (TIGR03803 family)